jgi:hypothetical protein
MKASSCIIIALRRGLKCVSWNLFNELLSRMSSLKDCPEKESFARKKTLLFERSRVKNREAGLKEAKA